MRTRAKGPEDAGRRVGGPGLQGVGRVPAHGWEVNRSRSGGVPGGEP